MHISDVFFPELTIIAGSPLKVKRRHQGELHAAGDCFGAANRSRVSAEGHELALVAVYSNQPHRR